MALAPRHMHGIGSLEQQWGKIRGKQLRGESVLINPNIGLVVGLNFDPTRSHLIPVCTRLSCEAGQTKRVSRCGTAASFWLRANTLSPRARLKTGCARESEGKMALVRENLNLMQAISIRVQTAS